jgi:hypothetical protein
LKPLSAREILVSITADRWEYCFRQKGSSRQSFTRFLALSNRFTSSVGPRMRSSARPCFVWQTWSAFIAGLFVQASGNISVKTKQDKFTVFLNLVCTTFYLYI